MSVSSVRSFGILALISLTLLLCAPSASRAQSQFDLGFGTDLSIEFSPEHPAPKEVVRIQARSTTIDLPGAVLLWVVDGETITEGAGADTVTVTAGPLGSETSIVLTVFENGVERTSAQAYIRPVELDLLWEADSYTPPFFRGRALPSAGTTLRLEARPRFQRVDGSLISTGDIIFTWRRNGYVIPGTSGRGKTSVVIEGPSLFGTDTISVEAKSTDELYESVASTRIASTEPHLALYQNHPVFGIAYHQALGAENRISETEASFSAVPYFADAHHPDSGDLLYEWRVNGTQIGNNAQRPSAITINAAGSAGTASVTLALTHISNFFLSASGSWGLAFFGGVTPFDTSF